MALAKFFSSEGMDLLPDGYLFTLPHFIYMIVSLFFVIYVVRWMKIDNPKRNKIVVLVLCGLLWFFKYAGEVVFVYESLAFDEPVSSFTHGFWDWRTLISFQICGVNNVLLPIAVLFNVKPMKDFTFLTSILGGITVILYPSTVLFGDPFTVTFPMVRSLIVHMILVALPLFLIRTGEFRLELKHWKRTLIGTILVFLWALYGNLVVDPGANYMFLMTNPFYDGPIPLLNQIPHGVHLPVIMALSYLSLAGAYAILLPWQKRLDLVKTT